MNLLCRKHRWSVISFYQVVVSVVILLGAAGHLWPEMVTTIPFGFVASRSMTRSHVFP